MTRDARVFEFPSRLSRADCILALLPLLFVSISVIGFWVFGTKTRVLGVAAIVCSVLLVDGIFVNPPVS